MAKRIAEYTIRLDITPKEADKILEEIDLFFIELEHKYPLMEVET